MRFKGELKFPDVDHPGVPVQFVIDGDQAELVVDEESLGRWSLYDVHARRLIASAFQIDLDGTEVTFVASDPIDFAYRGVEHMAESWASIKSKRLATRSLAIRKSRRGTTPSRIDVLREAMESNLEAMEPGRLTTRPSGGLPGLGAAHRKEEPEPRAEPVTPAPRRPAEEPVVDQTPEPASTSSPEYDAEREALAEERQRLEDERRQLDELRRAAEEREANLVEAYRLEMQRLDAEREELRRQTPRSTPPRHAVDTGVDEPVIPRPAVDDFVTPAPEPAVEPEPEPEPVVEREPEPEPEPVVEREPEPEREPVAPPEPEPEPEPEPQPEPVTRDEPAMEPAGGVLNLNEYESGEDRGGSSGVAAPLAPRPGPEPEPEPALAGAAKERKGGIMGAVKAAFRSGPRDHEHQFIEAPGGIGITRYVCEECGYVSISVGD
ncbi:MAG TPA: hypothetical protein VEB69_13970 [Acidimicrobiia bacterium]|nr:hypothetical protein [Acidimicrobiia bacterium]